MKRNLKNYSQYNWSQYSVEIDAAKVAQTASKVDVMYFVSPIELADLFDLGNKLSGFNNVKLVSIITKAEQERVKASMDFAGFIKKYDIQWVIVPDKLESLSDMKAISNKVFVQ